MQKRNILAIIGLSAAIFVGVATAHEIANPAIKARTSLMQLYANELGQLGAMAKGTVEYDAQAASSAANNLVLLTQLDQSKFWPAGSDSSSDSTTRALPELWQNFPDVMAKGQVLTDAALAMKAAAGTDLAALQAAMGPLGGACGSCHKAYRAPAE